MPYMKPPPDTCRGVIHGLDPDTTNEALGDLLQANRPQLIHARLMGRTTSALLTFQGPHVPFYVKVGSLLYRCRPFRRSVQSPSLAPPTMDKPPLQHRTSTPDRWLPVAPPKNTRICSRHFVNNAKSESQANPAYLPTLFPDVYKKRRVSGERHERWGKRNRSATRNLTSPHPPEESSPVDVLSNASEADCSPEADAQSKALEQGSLLLTEVELDPQQFTLTCVAETQTDPVCCKGPLQLMLSATDGTHGSTQVTHVAQADKVTHPEKTWARRCGFLGYESVKSSQQALQDLCSVTMTVFSILLNLLPEQRYRSSDVIKDGST
ncbi:uncharacterized protein LOC144156621 [Haemaphysalis longicornis]